jgi:cell division initiation protein
MDVTPRELRDIEIKEAFRGYNRDEVDELLERAAVSIERLADRVRQVTDRMAEAESGASRNREAEETLQRTLILAQRTADEAVNDATQRARKLLEDAESKARAMVTDAEATAHHIAETERQRLEAEIHDLSSRRDTLLSDVDALERFEGDYRGRIRAAIEDELEKLSAGIGARLAGVGPRPVMHDVEIPEYEPEPVGPLTAEVQSIPPEPPVQEPEPEWGGAAHANESMGEFAALVGDEPVESELLDDDAFFASLREAVRDDAPLGPRDDAPSGEYELDDDGGERRRFRRRR